MDSPISFYDTMPPHDLDAERALLGIMLVDGDALHEIVRTVNPAEFFGTALAALFGVFVGEVTAGRVGREGIDAIVFAAAVRRAGVYPEGREDIELKELARAAPHCSRWPQYAAIVRNHAQRRALANEAFRLFRAAHDSGDQPHAVAADCIGRIGTAVALGEQADGAHWADFMAVLQEEPNDALPTGIGELDALIGGLHRSHLIVVAARSGVGKSALMATMACAVMDAGFVAFIVSAEMTEKELLRRIASVKSGVPVNRAAQFAYATATERQVHEEWVGYLARAKRLQIWDTSAPPLGRVMVEASIAVERNKARVVFVDYLSKIQPPPELRRYNNRQQEVAAMIEGFKDLAKRLKVPVVVLAQINRDGVDKPRAHNLKESGQIEQAADSIIIMHVEEDQKPLLEQTVNIRVDKNRHGMTGEFNILYDRPTTSYKRLPDVPVAAQVPTVTAAKKLAKVTQPTLATDEVPF